MTVESEVKSAFSEVGAQVKGVKTRITPLEAKAGHNVIGLMTGVYIAPADPVPVGMPAWGLVVGEQV